LARLDIALYLVVDVLSPLSLYILVTDDA
jgi:hypothetical protein